MMVSKPPRISFPIAIPNARTKKQNSNYYPTPPRPTLHPSQVVKQPRPNRDRRPPRFARGFEFGCQDAPLPRALRPQRLVPKVKDLELGGMELLFPKRRCQRRRDDVLVDSGAIRGRDVDGEATGWGAGRGGRRVGRS